jgi:branched-chain amino acid transport system substrate-binding protein
MKRLGLASVALLAACLLPGASHAAGTIKIGVVMPYSGQFADLAKQMDNGIKIYMQQHGDKVADKTIEIIRRDVGGIDPPTAKRLAQELVVRDQVDILAGWLLTPNAIAGCSVSAEAKKFMVIMNAATSIITDKSPYCTRTSFTLPMITVTLGQWAAKHGIKNDYTLTADYAPGHDAEEGFIDGFKRAGGEIVGSVRMAVKNPDFSAYVQRAKDLDPLSIFVFIPGGSQPAAFGKALAERGMSAQTLNVLGTQELADDAAIKSMGDDAVGIITAGNYNYNYDSMMNKEFVAAYRSISGDENPNFGAVGGYDGMHLIYATLLKTNGKTDAEDLIAAAKGMQWESPRGPMMIDPTTRDVVQTIYISKVEDKGGKHVNVVIDSIPNVHDPVHAGQMK